MKAATIVVLYGKKKMGKLTRFLLISASITVLFASQSAWTQVDRSLEGDQKCTMCHDQNWTKPILTIYQTKHGVKGDQRTPGCQGCHGESVEHQGDPGSKPPEVVFTPRSKNISPVETRNAACLTCHETNVLPRSHWEGSQHEMHGVACTDCHEGHAVQQKVMNPLTQANVCANCHKAEQAQIHRFSRHPVLEGKVTCSNCHNPHGSDGPTLLVKETVNQTCTTCHAEKRGPFLWEHEPVADGCTNCHTPHGSNLSPLLKVRVPMLCQTCHTSDHAKNLYSGANLPAGNVTTANGQIPLGSQSPAAQGNARSCLGCHSTIHGSNHPAGAKFQR
jgi:DmsE family decaheme c-type cytochrome